MNVYESVWSSMMVYKCIWKPMNVYEPIDGIWKYIIIFECNR